MEIIVKRERSTNFNKSEVRLLTDLVAKHRTIIENKQTDAVTNKEKEAAWNKITVLFNAATGFTARSTKSLKLKYGSVKKETKKTMAKHRQELYRTGGGPSPAPDFTDIEKKVMAICSNITGLDARNDSNKIPEPKPKETVIVIPEALPPQTLENNIVVVPDDEIPCIIDHDDFCSQQVLKEIYNNAIENDKDVLDAYQPDVQVQDMEVKQTEKENNWSSWKPKAYKTKISPCLKLANQKITKIGVTAQLDQLTKSRLELVELQKDISIKEHELKILHLQNDKRRKQKMHEVLLSQLRNRVHYETNILDNN